MRFLCAIGAVLRRRRTRKHSVDCICLVLSSRTHAHAHARPYRSGCLLACLRGCRVVEVLAVSLSVGTRGHTHALSCSTSLSRFFGGPRCCWVIREEPASESEIPFDLARTERIVHSNTDTTNTTRYSCPWAWPPPVSDHHEPLVPSYVFIITNSTRVLYAPNPIDRSREGTRHHHHHHQNIALVVLVDDRHSLVSQLSIDTITNLLLSPRIFFSS